MPTFTGSSFFLESVRQQAAATIRVQYAQDPLAANPNGANDALNINNYTLTGPEQNLILSASTVSGDPQSIDLFLTAPLITGVWYLEVASNVQTTDSSSIGNPRRLSFDAVLRQQEAVNPGAVNTDAERLLRKFLNPALVGSNWNALIAALSVGDQQNFDNAQKAFNQLFLRTATGNYLQRLAADHGVSYPQNLGMKDERFQEYAINLTYGKITQTNLLNLLETFYGPDAIHASSTSGLAEPFDPANLDELFININDTLDVHVIFRTEDFALPDAATALEVANAITRACDLAGSDAYAVSITDPETGDKRVRIYSGSVNLSNSVKVTGGNAQNWLQFDEKLNNYNDAEPDPTWVITVNVVDGTTRFTTTTGATTAIDLSDVREGDYVNIFGTEFNSDNRGSFPITAVSWTYSGPNLVQYFEIEHQGTAESVLQLAEDSMLFFRPVRKTVYSNPALPALVAQTGNQLDVVLPATSQAVDRQEFRAAYNQLNQSYNLGSLTRRPDGSVLANLTAHGLSVGDNVYIDFANAVVAVPATTAGAHTNPGTSDSSPRTIVSDFFTSPLLTWANVACLTADGKLLLAGGETLPGNTQTQATRTLTLNSLTTSTTTGAKTVAYTYSAALGNLPANDKAFSAFSLTSPVSAFSSMVLVTGGRDAGFFTEVATTAYTSNGVSWTAGPTMNVARYSHAQVTLNDGQVLVCGGIYVGAPPNTLASSERLTLAGSWVNTPSDMFQSRARHTATKLNSGKVLVTGGNIDGTNLTNLCEIYDPAGDSWSRTGSMTYAREYHSAILLPNGKVMVVGGQGYNPTQSTTSAAIKAAEIYDPDTGRWYAAGKTSYNHRYSRAVWVPSKQQVVLVGGDTSEGTNVEAYDYKTGKWMTICQLPRMVTFPQPILMTVGGQEVVVIVDGLNGAGTSSLGLNTFYIPNSDTVVTGQATGPVTVASIVDANNFTYNTPGYGYSSFSGAKLIKFAAQNSSIAGPYIFDPTGGVGITGKSSTVTTKLEKFQHYSSVNVGDATVFPDQEGWLVFNFGKSTQCGPVRYFGRMSNTSLALDFSFEFPFSVEIGGDVSLLVGKGTFDPSSLFSSSIGAFYLTDSPSGRIGAANAIDLSVAAGLDVNKNVVYPDDWGLGNSGWPVEGSYKVSDVVWIWGSNDSDEDIQDAKDGEL